MVHQRRRKWLQAPCHKHKQSGHSELYALAYHNLWILGSRHKHVQFPQIGPFILTNYDNSLTIWSAAVPLLAFGYVYIIFLGEMHTWSMEPALARSITANPVNCILWIQIWSLDQDTLILIIERARCSGCNSLGQESPPFLNTSGNYKDIHFWCQQKRCLSMLGSLCTIKLTPFM